MQKIEKLRKLFLDNGEVVGGIEYTSGNYDEKGNLIKEDIPTFTTEFCEVGVYNNIIYFTFVIYSDSYSDKLINNLEKLSNFFFNL